MYLIILKIYHIDSNKMLLYLFRNGDKLMHYLNVFLFNNNKKKTGRKQEN